VTVVPTELAALRRSFDDIDARLLQLLAERAQLAVAAGRVKRAAGLPIVDDVREADAARTRRIQAGALGIDPALVDEVFAAIVRHSRRVQGAP
jgi:chorismate mutase-like protein